MKICQALISVIFSLNAVLIPLLASAEPLAISITQRDGKVSLATCMNEGRRALQRRKFKNIEASNNSIKGDYQDYLAMISCYETTTVKGILVQSIVVTGPLLNLARQLRDEIVEAID